MGLVYSSGDSSNLLSSLSSNLGTAKSTVNELKSGSQRLTAAVDGRTLSGAAYNAGKGLFSELILPTINRVTASMDGIQNDLVKYEGANKEISKEGYLNEDNLKLQIQLMKASKSALTASADTFKNLATVSPIPGLKDMLNHAQERLNRMANSMQDDIDKVQKKIKKLHDFSSQTNGLFSNSLNEMKIAMQGVLVLSGTVVNSDGSYSLPSGTDKSWFNSLQDKKSDYEDIVSLLQTTGVTIASEKAEKIFMEKGLDYSQRASNYIWSNRYSIEMFDGRILGEVPGATLAAREATEGTVKGVSKYFGKALTEGAGTLVGVGMDMYYGDTAEEAWGKEITTGVATAGVVGAIGMGSSALVSVGLLANPIGVGVVGAIAIGVGVGIANDWLRDNFKEVKDFEDKVGNAVVSGWNNFAGGVSDFFGGVFS
ncbi:T7SS effector LXG polymorphic toxin [Carnobacterium divergens]|uniref:T7SS effector LXG polymorphic toxin n=1 Tax=Carnobacterium divergens TaxID=2748 RepID=UPI002890C93B|nr:T7SS effector LXG polymorphic toxin [Carnobacterium divergens]MDT2011674.1 LXG domain-containing protein [Carnobacterium divergens]